MPPKFQLDEDDDAAHTSAVFVKAPEHAYEAVYSPARRYLRQIVTKEVEREMPVLVAIQERYRTPGLDMLFVLTGMLGNHTFFFLALPFLHIFGLGQFARGLTNVVLWSVYFSGAAKDYISAPRPKSPPVTQITRSPAHTLEYGFPSSHTTYVVGTILYITYYMLAVWDVSVVLACVLWTAGAVIVAGRIYCGLHSFIDVAGGMAIGAAQAWAFVCLHEWFDALMLSTAGPLYMAAILYLALTTIPRSLDLCPCLIDAFCATSVSLGVFVGAWLHARLPFLCIDGQHDRIAWSTSLTLAQNTLRVIVCVVLIVVWKLASKPIAVGLVKRFVIDAGFVATAEYCDSDSGTDVELESDCAAPLDSKAAGNGLSSMASSYSGSSAVSLDQKYIIPSHKDIRAGRYGTYELMAAPENIARVPIYAGIGFIVAAIAPVFYYLLGLMPR